MSAIEQAKDILHGHDISDDVLLELIWAMQERALESARFEYSGHGQDAYMFDSLAEKINSKVVS